MSRASAKSEWFRTFDDALWLQAGEEGTDRHAAFLRKALRLSKGSRVLDAPCGAARITVHLARMGCGVTGIDLLGEHIRKARSRFRKEELKGAFRVGDLRAIDFDGTFDGIVNWGGSFGYFSDEENDDVVRRYARALKRGGRLLIDQPNRENVLRHFRSRTRRGNLLTSTRWDARTQRAETLWTITEDGRRRSSRSSIRLYTPAQFRAMLKRAGLRLVAMYGTHDGAPWRRGSRRTIVTGQKE